MINSVKTWFTDLPRKEKVSGGIAVVAVLVAVLFPGLLKPPSNPSTIYQIPVYPGSIVIGQKYDEGSCVFQQLVTSDSTGKVLDYYHASLSAAGWVLPLNLGLPGHSPTSERFDTSRDQYHLSVDVDFQAGGGTAIQVWGQMEGHVDYCKLSAKIVP